MIKKIDIFEFLNSIIKMFFYAFQFDFLKDIALIISLKIDAMYKLAIVLSCIGAKINSPTIFDVDQIHQLSIAMMKLMPKLYSRRTIDAWTRDKFKAYFDIDEINRFDSAVLIKNAIYLIDINAFKLIWRKIRGKECFLANEIVDIYLKSNVKTYVVDMIEHINDYYNVSAKSS